MAKAKKQAKATLPYIRRVVEDEHLQEHLRNAVGGLRRAYTRAKGQRGGATEDKKFYANLRQAATSIRNAASTLQQPKPQPKRRFQKLAAAALADGSALLVFKQQKGQSNTAASSDTSSGQACGSRQIASDCRYSRSPLPAIEPSRKFPE